MNHIVALSGGKDSTALALRLAEVEPRQYQFVCTPTKNESSEMEAHWCKLEGLLGAPLVRLSYGNTLETLIGKFGSLPNNRQRWCTRILKIEPFEEYLRKHTPAVAYVGLRADEPERSGAIYDDQPDVTQRYPMREWGWRVDDVRSYLRCRGVSIPKRTDCLLCYDQRIVEWYDLWKNNPVMWARGKELEAQTGHTFRSPSRDTWPASMAEMEKEFERGRPIRGFKTTEQMELIGEQRCRACRI